MSKKKNDKGFVYLQQADGQRVRIPFEDATSVVTLTVTAEDIKQAVCGDPFNCVMARTFRRAFPMSSEVRMGKTAMHVVMGQVASNKFSMRYDVRGALKKAVHQFDRSKGASGFTAGQQYTLYPPTPSDRRGARPNRPYNSKGGKGTQKRLTERRAVIRPSRNVFCFIPVKPL